MSKTAFTLDTRNPDGYAAILWKVAETHRKTAKRLAIKQGYPEQAGDYRKLADILETTATALAALCESDADDYSVITTVL